MTTLAHIEAYFIPEPNSGCWLWVGAIGARGYGSIWSNGRNWPAHRVTYELLKCAVPHGLVLDHKCRVRSCVNPDHLEAVTHRVNILRGVGIAPLALLKTHCPQGHPLIGDNVVIVQRPRGDFRRCLVCFAEQARRRDAAYRRRNKARTGFTSGTSRAKQ